MITLKKEDFPWTSLCWSLVSDYEEEGKDNPELERNEMEDENLVDTGKVKMEVTRYLEFMVKHSKKLYRWKMEKGVKYYRLKVIDLSAPCNELEEIGKLEDLTMRKLFGKIHNDIITKIDDKVGKKELNYEDIKITRFL